MAKLYDRVKVATTTTGTGTIALGAPERSAANGDFLSFAEAGVVNGDVVPYWIIDGATFAKGEGTYTSANNTLSRDANEQWWNGSVLAPGKLPLSGQAKVFISPRAADILSTLPATVAKTDANNLFTKSQRVQYKSINNASGTITLDPSESNVFWIAMAGNVTIANPTNLLDFVGQDITILFTGAFSASFGSYWKFPKGVAPSFTGTRNVVGGSIRFNTEIWAFAAQGLA
jgi:hypothetical protein